MVLGQADTLSQLWPACLGLWGTRRESRSGVFQLIRGLVLFPLRFLGPLVVSAGTPCVYNFIIIVLLSRNRFMYERVLHWVGVP